MADADRIRHLLGLEAHLRSHIIGQDHVLPRVAAAFARGELGIAQSGRPRGSFLFAGPTGSGKTETFSCAIDYAFGSGHLVAFDMSEYQDKSAVNKLIGADRDDPGLLGRALANCPGGGLLFDEIEKAYPLVLDLFLQILWNGRVTLATGQTLGFDNYYVGFTSNIGGAEAMRMAHSRFASVEQAVLRRVAQSLRPELLVRINEIMVFTPLSADAQREICALLVAAETARLRHLGYDLQVSREAMEFLVREGFHPQLGARPLRRTVERQLQDAVVRELFRAGIARGRVLLEAEQRRLLIGDS